MAFLKEDNYRTLQDLIGRYLKERKGVAVPPEDFANELRQTMITVVQEARAGRIKGDLESLNRLVVSQMIQRILQRFPSPLLSPAPAAPAAPAPEPEPTPYRAAEDDTEAFELAEEAPVNKDIDFMNKLNALELTRRLPVTSIAGGGAGSGAGSADTVKSTMDLLLPQVSSANIPTQIATVFLPQPPQKGQEVLINSWQRNWIQCPSRNGFAWNGPIPTGVDLSHSRVLRVFLPRRVCDVLKSPYIVLHLEGAGGQVSQSILVPELGGAGAGADGGGWGAFVPAANDLGYLKTLACPWTVKVWTADGRMVNLGRDGEMATVDATGALEPMASAADGDQLWVFGAKGQIHLWNVEKTNPWAGHWEDGSGAVAGGGAVVNFTRQWSILLDLVQKR